MTSTLPKIKRWSVVRMRTARPWYTLVRNLAAGAGTVLDIYPEPDTSSQLYIRAEDAKRRARVILRDIEAAKHQGPRPVRTKRVLGRLRAKRNLLLELKKNEENMQETVKAEACNALNQVGPHARRKLMALIKQVDCDAR